MNAVAPRALLVALALAALAGAQSPCEFQKLELGPPAATWWYPVPGRSVDIDGERAVVSGRSRAHVFELQGGRWVAVATLFPPQPSGSFGRCVAISGDVLAVGAPEDSTQGAHAGAVFVYERQAAQWVELGAVFASDAGPDRLFGASLALEDDALVVGSPGEGATPGAAYVFERSGAGGLPLETARLTTASGYNDNAFGTSVATHGGTVVVGDSHYLAQLVRVYERGGPGGNAWVLAAEIAPGGLQAEDQYGAAVAVWGDTLVVGAPMHRFQGHWYYPGAAFVYERVGGEWLFRRKLLEPRHYYERGLGASVAVEGDVILVGAPGTDYPWGWDDDVYVFRRGPNGGWHAQATTLFSGDQTDDAFGQGVAISQGRAIVGAPANVDALGEVVGAAYVTCLDPLGTVVCESGHQRSLRLTGSAVAGDNALVLTVRSGSGRGYFLMGDGTGVVDVPGPGSLCLAGGPSGVLRIDQPMLDPDAQLELAIDLTAIRGLPGGVLAGETWRFQAWWWEFYYQQGAFSNAVSVTFQ